MKKQYSYSIIFNDLAKAEHSFSYDYGSVKSIALDFSHNGAKISFSMSTKKSCSDFLNFSVRPFKDAYSKILVVYSLLYSNGLKVSKISINTPDENKRYNEDTTENFPFLFSMLEDNPISINKNWKKLAQPFCNSNKTTMQSDKRFISVYSYLQACASEYEYLKFQALWASMNAYYSYVAESFEEFMKCKYNVSDDELNKISISTTDAASIGLVSYLMCGSYKVITKAESNALKTEYSKAKYIVSKILDKNIEKTYKLTKNNKLDGFNEYRSLLEVTQNFGVSAHAFLTFGYPYSIRCSLLHGNKIPPLIVCNEDPELKTLKVVNYYMQEYLKENIPGMFGKNYWNEETVKKVFDYYQECYPSKNKTIIKIVGRGEKDE